MKDMLENICGDYNALDMLTKRIHHSAWILRGKDKENELKGTSQRKRCSEQNGYPMRYDKAKNPIIPALREQDLYSHESSRNHLVRSIEEEDMKNIKIPKLTLRHE